MGLRIMHEPIAVEAAAPAKRLAAFLYDYLLIAAYAVALVGVMLVLSAVSTSMGREVTWPTAPFQADLLAFVMLVLPVILYFTLQEGSSKQGTWGKRKKGLRVTDSAGGQLTKKAALARSILKFLPWQIAHTSLFHIEGWPFNPTDASLSVIAGMVIVWALVATYLGSLLLSKNHHTLYDWATGARVVDKERGNYPR